MAILGILLGVGSLVAWSGGVILFRKAAVKIHYWELLFFVGLVGSLATYPFLLKYNITELNFIWFSTFFLSTFTFGYVVAKHLLHKAEKEFLKNWLLILITSAVINLALILSTFTFSILISSLN